MKNSKEIYKELHELAVDYSDLEKVREYVEKDLKINVKLQITTDTHYYFYIKNEVLRDIFLDFLRMYRNYILRREELLLIKEEDAPERN